METLLSARPAYMLAPITAVHPPDLETDDPSLATEVLPAPPPLSSITGQRRESHLKRPTQIFSYLPASDPGTTYSGLMGGLGLVLVPEEESRLRKRARTEKAATNLRTQRTSARNLNPTISYAFPSPPEASTSECVIEVADTAPAHARASSVVTISDEPTLSGSVLNNVTMTRDREKEKGKEVVPPVVKEEPQNITLDMFESGGIHQPNDDHCSSCRSHGGLLYCDGCPRSFHLWCLDPPMDTQEVPEGEDRWYCPACVIRQNPPPKPYRSLLAPLLQQLYMSIPTEFELPEEIRTFFKDVATGPKGSYQDNTETKPVRTSRFTILEERDPARLKDKNGSPVLCFRCGKSALPDGKPSIPQISSPNSGRDTRSRRSTSKIRAGESLWKSIVSCDYCSLHWHLDCLEPPLTSMPPAHKKWMCPAHIEHIAPKRRVPRQLPPVTDITGRHQLNNGNIDIIPADNAEGQSNRLNVDEVHINGRRYRIPERVIVLDFWDKLGRRHCSQMPPGLLSGLSSPLTSLSSLDSFESPLLPSVQASQLRPDSATEVCSSDSSLMHAVELLVACRTAVVHHPDKKCLDVDLGLTARRNVAVQTESEAYVNKGLKDAKEMIGPKSATLKNLDHSQSSSRRTNRATPCRPSKARNGNILRPVRSNPVSARSFKASSRLPLDSGAGRVTRSKRALSKQTSTQIQPPKTIPTSSPSRITRATRSFVGTGIISPSTVSRVSSPFENRDPGRSSPVHASKTTHSNVESHKRLRPSPSCASVKAESSSLTTRPAPASNPIRSPFKIRIPRAINTAVAAATAAAAASGAAPSMQKSNKTSRPIRRQISSGSESGSSSTSFIRGVRVKGSGLLKFNGVMSSGIDSPSSTS